MRRPWFAIIVCVVGLGLTIQAEITQAGLEDTLYDKGIITKEEWLKTKADQERYEAIIQSERAATEKWYEKLSIRGYTQIRYNYLTDDKKLVDPVTMLLSAIIKASWSAVPVSSFPAISTSGCPCIFRRILRSPPHNSERPIITKTLPKSETSTPISF